MPLETGGRPVSLATILARPEGGRVRLGETASGGGQEHWGWAHRCGGVEFEVGGSRLRSLDEPKGRGGVPRRGQS